MANIPHGNSNQKTLVQHLLSLLIHIYLISPVWWLSKVWERLGIQRSSMVYQNTTDCFVFFRLLVAYFLVSMPSRLGLVFTSVFLFEMTIAYIAHFFSDRFNAAGPGKVTSVRRTLALAGVNFISYIFLYAALLAHFENLNRVDSIYLSTITITTLGYGDVTPHTAIGKIVVSSEALMGLFQVAFVLGTIIGWAKSRERISP